MIRKLLAITAATVLAAGIVGCGTSSNATTDSGEIDRSAVLRIGGTQGTNSLDPHMAASELASFKFGLAAIYDRLFTITSAGDVEGMLVTSSEYSEDGHTLTLTLREDVTFRDGTALDAQVVKVNLDRARTLQSPVVHTLTEPVEAVTVIDDYTVVLSLTTPTTAVPEALAGMAGMMMHPDLVANGDPATEPNGSGAYSMESYAPQERLTLVRDREDYWDTEAAQLAGLEYIVIPDFQAYTNALAGGQIDIGSFQPGNVAALEGRNGLTTVSVPQGTGVELYFNTGKEPLGDIRVRQAINHAYDREAIVEALYPGSVARYQYTREGLSGYDESLEGFYDFDPAAARALLAEAGHPDGIDLGTVLISSAITPGLADVLAEQLSQAGITFEPRIVDAFEGTSAFGTGGASAFLHFSSVGTSLAGGAPFRWEAALNPGDVTPEYTELRALAVDSRRSPEERETAAVALNRYLVEQALAAPVVWIDFPWIMKDNVIGFSSEMDYATTWGPYDPRYLAMSN